VQRVYPTHEPVEEVSGLIEAYRYPPISDRAYVRATMVTTLDGAAWGPDGRSGSISARADRETFAVMRGLADVILVGAGTVRAEVYRPAITTTDLVDHRVTAGQQPDPVIAVVSRALDLDPAAPLFTEAAEPTIVITTERSPVDRRDVLSELARVVVTGTDDIDVDRALGALANFGLLRVMCEGGPTLLAHMAAVGRIDELCLTVTPLLAGGHAPRIVDGAPSLTGQAMSLAHILEEDGMLLTRWVRQPAPNTSARS
jgi:riboflavin biosynthesis pyrimidine reductase